MTDCSHSEYRLALAGKSNNVGAWCDPCERWVTKELQLSSSTWLGKSHRLLRGVDRAALPRVLTDEGDCEICGVYTATLEEHHWCPRGLYRDRLPAGGGPTAALCQQCHRLWHEWVTPFLVSGVTEARAKHYCQWLYNRDKIGWPDFVRAVLATDKNKRLFDSVPR